MTEQEWDALRQRANAAADGEYSTEVSNVIRLTKHEIEAVITEASVSKDKLAALMMVVNAATRSNREKADALRNTAGLAEMAVALLGTLV